MSYTPTTWETGDTITAEKLNNIEQGIVSGGGGGLLILDESNMTFLSVYTEEHQLPDNLFVYNDDLNAWDDLFNYYDIYIYDGDPTDLVTHNIMIRAVGSGPK